MIVLLRNLNLRSCVTHHNLKHTHPYPTDPGNRPASISYGSLAPSGQTILYYIYDYSGHEPKLKLKAKGTNRLGPWEVKLVLYILQ